MWAITSVSSDGFDVSSLLLEDEVLKYASSRTPLSNSVSELQKKKKNRGKLEVFVSFNIYCVVGSPFVFPDRSILASCVHCDISLEKECLETQITACWYNKLPQTWGLNTNLLFQSARDLQPPNQMLTRLVAPGSLRGEFIFLSILFWSFLHSLIYVSIFCL